MRDRINASLQRLKEQHEAAMLRINEERDGARAAAKEVEDRRLALLQSPEAIQAEIQKIPDQQQTLSRDISRLKSESGKELTESYPGRMAQFLGYFMRDSSQDERVAAVLTFFIPCLALIMAFAPAMVLEVVLHGLIINREKSLPSRNKRWFRRIRFGNRALLQQRGIVASRTVALDRREKALEEACAQSALELEQRRRLLEEEFEARVSRKTDELQLERDAARKALEEENGSIRELLESHQRAHAEAIELMEKQREDIKLLASTILEFDARNP